MAWDHLSITKPHLVYIILGGFTSLFMLCSTVIKERLYIGEATVATICGIIFGPHAANLIDPNSWGSVDVVTIEFSRIVLVVQCFAVGVELPKFYMEKHWKSVVFLLLPVMTFGWLVTSLVIWWMINPLTWLESLVVAACVTATDPVLASSVVGKGKFAKRVPKHLRDLLSAESGCNDGMAFPFVYLSLYLLQDHLSTKEVTFNWIVITILYECIFGAIYGFMVGYIARHGIKYAEQRELIDRESFLVFYFVLALFCAGSGSILGVDDLLVGFACGVGFSNDGWFTQKTEESHVSNVIDLLINLTYFVFFGTIIPWDQFNNAAMGMHVWRLVVIAIFVLVFRRIPIMMALKPVIPDIKTWREALFAGHFGPIGVGAIFVAILARAELEQEKPVPMSDPPKAGTEFYTLATLVWPIVTFLVVTSILVHGSSIAVFTLGKRINTLTLTMSYTTAPEDGPSWMNRLPRISSVSKSQAKSMSDTDLDEMKMPDYPPGTLPPIGLPGNFLRRQKEDEKGHSRNDSRASSTGGRRRKAKRWDSGIGPGGPISESAIFPQRRTGSQSEETTATLQVDSSNQSPDEEVASPTDSVPRGRGRGRDRRHGEARDHSAVGGEQERPGIEVYDEGDNIIVENEQGDVLAVEKVGSDAGKHAETLKSKLEHELEPNRWTIEGIKKKISHFKAEEVEKRKDNKPKTGRKHEPARAYQFGNTIIVEDEDGEVVRKYELPSDKSDSPGYINTSLKYMGMGKLAKDGKQPVKVEPAAEGEEPQKEGGEPSEAPPLRPGLRSVSTWTAAVGLGRSKAGDVKPAQKEKKKGAEEEDDRHIRFTIGGVGQRMNKEDFIQEMRKYDKGTRREIMDHSDASTRIKSLANEGAKPVDTLAQSATRKGKTSASTAQQPKGSASAQQKDSAKTTTAQRVVHDDSRRGSPSNSSPAASTLMEASPHRVAKDAEPSSRDEPETAVERRRRLAVLQSVDDDEENDGARETPAERRRREAALGMSSQGADDDSDDDDTPRMPRRGIRFADQPARG